MLTISRRRETRSGYDLGHLAPAANMSFFVKTMSESQVQYVAPGSTIQPGIGSKLKRLFRLFKMSL